MKRDDLSLLKDPCVERIEPYTFRSRAIDHDDAERSADEWKAICAKQGGFNPLTRELLPLKVVSSGMELHETLDHITAAVEAGMVDKNAWSTQLFASEDDFDRFMEELESYDDCYRITDRWWTALAALADLCDEEAFISCAEIANGLHESILEGTARREVLRQESEYFAKHPLAPLKLTREQSEALEAHNDKLQQRSYEARAGRDLTLEFRFGKRFLYMKGKVLAARQVTADDLAALVAPVKKVPVAKSKAKSTKRGAGKD